LTGTLEWATYTAFMSYKYSLPLGSSLEKLIPYFGLDVTIDDIWNMIPLTFVLDYVWKFGKALELMNRKYQADIINPIFGESIAHYKQSGMSLDVSACVAGSTSVVNGRVVKGGYPLLTGYQYGNYLRLPRGKFTPVFYPGFKMPSNRQTLLGLGVAMNLFR
jgi:hypothetical protein